VDQDKESHKEKSEARSRAGSKETKSKEFDNAKEFGGELVQWA
jgi:hypothetical protein